MPVCVGVKRASDRYNAGKVIRNRTKYHYLRTDQMKQKEKVTGSCSVSALLSARILYWNGLFWSL